MSDFLDWHPSSVNAERLYDERINLQEIILKKPVKGVKILKADWKFGKVSEIWDDYIFDHCIRPVLDKNDNANIRDAIRRYSYIDHLLFEPYVRREENPVRFRRAFWNINSYGLRIAKRFEKVSRPTNIHALKSTDHSKRKKIAFVLKGPYIFAHVEFLHSFLNGCAVFSKFVEISLILIDDYKETPKNLDHISIISLSNYEDPYEKLVAYQKYCLTQQFDHICWVAPIQNFSLYMGMQLAPCQSYWSMKYHSIVVPTIQKYAGLGFGGKSFKFDDQEWYRGRAFPDMRMPIRDSRLVKKLRTSCNLSQVSILIGCFVRAEKLYDEQFWNSIVKIIASSSKVHFVIASQSIPDALSQYIANQSSSLQARFHHLGWVDTKNWAFALDIYFDSSPRGSCNTIFEAIEAGVPVLLADSPHNRESSALPYLSSAANSFGLSNTPGVFGNERSRLNACIELLADPQKRLKLASNQMKMLKSLKGQSHLFAKDYLNFFLDTNFKISDLNP